jgi:hypothetical protein
VIAGRKSRNSFAMSKVHWRFASLLILAQVACSGQTGAIEPDENAASALEPAILPAPVVRPSAESVPQESAARVDWKGLLRQSFTFLAVEEGFRIVTEPGARHTHKPFFKGYADSVANLHGWADGDPFLVNYVGHPMQGAVSGFIWIQNDRRYRMVEFGRNQDYWKSRLRAAAFAFVYSEEEEIGPISEASIGATQSFFPQQGFADHVVTPVIGLGWMVTEDAIDTYVIKRLESRTNNPYLKLVLRGTLNPSRSFANVLAGRMPWIRETRPGVFVHARPYPEVSQSSPTIVQRASSAESAFVPPFEVSILTLIQQGSASGGPCIGGGADASFRWANSWQLVVEVTGCKMTGLGEHLSGDLLNYMVGPRWTPVATNRWSPYAQLLAGGQRNGIEKLDPAAKAALAASYEHSGQTPGFAEHDLYTSDSSSNAFALKLGVGVDLKLRGALAVRMIGIDYTYSAIHHAQIQVTGGLLLRLGTW